MTPPSPTSAGGKERRAAARAPAPAPGPGGKARGAVEAGGRLRGRAPGRAWLDPFGTPGKEGGRGRVSRRAEEAGARARRARCGVSTLDFI